MCGAIWCQLKQSENEKLFDRSDAKLYWRTVLHTFFIYHHAYVGSYSCGLENALKNSGEDKLRTLYTFRIAYLTGWNFAFQTVFLFLAVGHDILQWADKQHTSLGVKLRYWRDVIYNGLVVPYSCFVFGMFWSLYSIDRELVFPRVYDDVVPWWFNHCVHTNIMILVAIETFLQARREPTDKRMELILKCTVGILYAIVYYTIYFFAHRWLYNVFGVMNLWQICLFQLGIWSSSFIFYFIHFPINRLIHGVQETSYEIPEKNGDLQNGNVTFKNGNILSKTVELTHKNEAKNGEATKTDVPDNRDGKANGVDLKGDQKNIFTITHSNTDLNIPPFSTRSWSLKYRNLRSQFENSSL
ncbi:androgen-dependent TFPI-regulating protein-like [Hyposmocoma kahamanoa]|uniref:androgen-dependent TFPI-regulating protein-like n=1 Tax=Hyposmocoma kahamanoa TaxID=1477025 RepID=UPI000E6D7187|nr:androgen-dependent TFPI-regulating protein-like [Hyposmocoma kahamanoa]